MGHRRLLERLQSPVVAFPLSLVAALATCLALESATGSLETAAMVAITVFCIGLWILTPIPPAYTGVLGIGLLAVVFSPAAALTGFQQPATWLIGFGLLMGEATRRSGLAICAGHRLAAVTLSSASKASPLQAYRRLLLALALGAHALALFIPSSLVRVLILAPVLIEIGSRFDSREAQAGLFLGPLLASFYGSSGILTADLANIIVVEFGQSIAGHRIGWAEWAVQLYPIMGLARVLLVVGIVYLLFRPPTGQTASAIAFDGGEHTAGSAERRMGAFLLVGALVWATDFVHGFHPVVGAVAVVALAFLPGIGVVDFETVGTETDFSILFFIAAVFAIGDGLAETGFTDTAAESLLALAPMDAPLPIMLAFVFLCTLLLAVSMEGLAIASVFTPILISYTEAAGLPLEPVLLTETMALTTFFFPYQSAVLVVILAQGVVDAGELIKALILCSLATIVFLLPLQLALFGLVY
ncbi:sodium:sulfate symporter [Natronolimnobius sp. AArcel1]|uniref:SLC13 family permease n=1 Tax=Natronolimnobius sp. AArcel1 TaxID=1679093 RepID=UPI0013EBD293|nr:SLC13 family permease [Natronolimnobius sp. AArcel1]NGM69793.1 sodium:sulfate symporter [Natronolimnobius sp. AArcel1]